jgi:hypothetical protein
MQREDGNAMSLFGLIVVTDQSVPVVQGKIIDCVHSN